MPALRWRSVSIRSCAVSADLHCPLVTAVNGPAAGAGMSFALMGDMILCARSSYFLQAFRRIGLVPDCGSTWLLPRMIGKARSVELSLMGERLPAEKALEWGLVNRVYDDAALMDEAMKLAHDLANGPTIALSLIRKLYWDSPENSFEEQLNLEFESQRVAGSRGRFQGRRHRIPRETAGEILGQMIEADLGRCVASFYPGATGVTGAAKLSGGASQETWTFRHRAPERQCRRRSCAARRRAMALRLHLRARPASRPKPC